MTKIKINRVPCPKCDESVIEGATRCPHCKEDIDCSVAEEVVQEVEEVEEVEVQEGISLTKKILVMAYILAVVVFGIYEYKAYGFLEDARVYAREGLNDTAQNVHQYIVDEYRFSFSVAEASSELGVKVVHSFPLFAGWVCGCALVLMFLLRLISGAPIFRVLIFGLAAVTFLVAQLVWYDSLDFDSLNELARNLMKEPQASYVISYALLLVTVGFSLGNNLKNVD